MRKIYFIIYLCIYCISSYAQRATGYGRGSDYVGGSGGVDYLVLIFFALVIVIGGPILLIEKIKEKKKLKSGEYIKIVSDGWIISTPNKYNQHLEVIKTWTLQEFENQFGTFSYRSRKRNYMHKDLAHIVCTKESKETIVYVPYDCDYDIFFQRMKNFRIAQVKNGGYILYRTKL